MAFWTLTNETLKLKPSRERMSPRAGVLTCKIYSDLRVSEFRLEFNLTAEVDAVQHSGTYETERCFSQDIRNNFRLRSLIAGLAIGM